MNLSSSGHLISPSSVIIAAKEPVSSELDGEVVVLNPKLGKYFGLDNVSARIWELIQEPKTVDNIQNIILSEYDIDADRCEQDIVDLFQDMAKNGLIEVKA